MKHYSTVSGNTTLRVLLALLAIAAIVLGAVALHSSLACKKSIDDLQMRLEAQATSNGQIASDVQQLRSGVQGALTTLGQEVVALRDQLNKKLEPVAPAKDAKAADAKAGAKAQEPTGPGTFHKIASGDTFGRLANQYGTSVSEIEKLNPGVSSRTLKIGQKVRVK